MQTTPNIGLTIFENGDKPGWLRNWNSNMNKIDAAVQKAVSDAAGVAGTAGQANATAEQANATAEQANATAEQVNTFIENNVSIFSPAFSEPITDQITYSPANDEILFLYIKIPKNVTTEANINYNGIALMRSSTPGTELSTILAVKGGDSIQFNGNAGTICGYRKVNPRKVIIPYE